MKYGLPFAIITKSLLKKKKKNHEKRLKCWKPESSFPATFFKAFFYMVIRCQDYSQLIKNDS